MVTKIFHWLKVFLKMNAEDKGFTLIGGAIVLFIVKLVLFLLGISNLGTGLLCTLACLLFSTGCFYVCYATKGNREIGAKPMVIGSYGLVGLLSLEISVSYMTDLFGFTLPTVTVYYAFPLLALFWYGLGRILFGCLLEKWRAA